MISFKLIIFLAILFLLSCTQSNKKIISKWGDGKTKIERIYFDTPGVYVEKEYYESGELEIESRFADSLKNGQSVAYYKNGKLLGKSVYKNGKINGEVTEFHRTGGLMFKGTQVDGKLVGIATHFYDNGGPETQLYYKDDKVFLVNYWDSSGKQQVNNGNGIRKFHDYLYKDKNGNDTSIKVFVVGIYKDSLNNGLWKYYNLVDNKLVLEIYFKDDKVAYETWK